MVWSFHCALLFQYPFFSSQQRDQFPEDIDAAVDEKALEHELALSATYSREPEFTSSDWPCPEQYFLNNALVHSIEQHRAFG
jgi:hypothetical protein